MSMITKVLKLRNAKLLVGLWAFVFNGMIIVVKKI
jgi:hypothetical protein